jgi:hypothetical protein
MSLGEGVMGTPRLRYLLILFLFASLGAVEAAATPAFPAKPESIGKLPEVVPKNVKFLKANPLWLPSTAQERGHKPPNIEAMKRHLLPAAPSLKP